MRLVNLGAYALACAAIGAACAASAAEPNDDFASATVLAPGVRTVNDSVFPSPTPSPDTTLGAFNESAALIESDDDSSPLGDSRASALFGIPVNPDGSISLRVSGFADFDFDGLDDQLGVAHSEQGGYEVYVDVFDPAGLQIDAVSDAGVLNPGAVDPFLFSDAAWIGGSYSVAIDNFVNFSPGDVDFFRFTGLPPGMQFDAEIPSGDFDTVLGQFDIVTGDLIALDDDGGGDMLSALRGTVPASGEVVLAVTGFNDFGFVGAHHEQGDYTLSVSVVVPEPTASGLAFFALGGLTRAWARRRGSGARG